MTESLGNNAEVAKLVDAPDLGSGAARCESSSLSFRTIFDDELSFLSIIKKLYDNVACCGYNPARLVSKDS